MRGKGRALIRSSRIFEGSFSLTEMCTHSIFEQKKDKGSVTSILKIILAALLRTD